LKKQPTKRPRSNSSDESESDSDSDDSDDSDRSKQSATPARPDEKTTAEEDKEAKKRLEVFDDHLQNAADSLLLICKQDCLLFVDNRKRDKTVLEVPYEDLIYCMGKGDILKMGLLTKPKMPTVENQLVDVRTEFTVKNARVIAEDIMAYC